MLPVKASVRAFTRNWKPHGLKTGGAFLCKETPYHGQTAAVGVRILIPGGHDQLPALVDEAVLPALAHRRQPLGKGQGILVLGRDHPLAVLVSRPFAR